MNLLDFRIEGKTSRKSERLNSSRSWFDILLRINFVIFVGILLGPTAFTGLRGKTIIWIFILSTGFMKKELLSISGRKLWNLCLENLIVDWIVLENFPKNLLNALIMSSGLVNEISLSVTVEGTEFEVLFRDNSFLIPFQLFFKSLICVWI